MNCSILIGVFPTAWKHAFVNPIPKVPNAKKVEKLRSISLLPIPGKILEKHLYSILTDHLETNKLFSKAQNSFRENHGTIDTVFKFLNNTTKTLHNRFPTACLFVDFKKAFDTISQDLLIRKLFNLALSEKVITVIKKKHLK